MKPKSRSTLFLMELIIAIFFFAITAAICTRVFAQAHLATHATTQLNQSILHIESMAEAFRSVDGDFESFALLFPEALTTPANDVAAGARDPSGGDHLEIFYDSEWHTCEPDQAVYQILVNGTNEKAIRTIHISAIDLVSGEAIYTLEVHKHPRLEAVHE